MQDNIYTGRQIAIFTDCHGLLEPLEAILEDINERGITEIYSLGDNIGVGPNPSEVIDIIEKNGVISIAGNAEEYCNLGIEPFSYYFNTLKTQSQLWTISKLNERQKNIMKLYPHSIDLLVGGKRIALCHFANDVRFDYIERSTWVYQDNIASSQAYRQFLYTNSLEQLEEMRKIINTYGKDSPMMRGYLSAVNDPLFNGNRVDFYDAIIQGHVHFKIYERGNNIDFYSIRAVGMAYDKDPIDTASHVILKEKANNKGYDLEEILVKYDRERMEHSILNSDGPMNLIMKFTNFGVK